jgi:hypothetical protein
MINPQHIKTLSCLFIIDKKAYSLLISLELRVGERIVLMISSIAFTAYRVSNVEEASFLLWDGLDHPITPIPVFNERVRI